jgi:hypothetical protein
LTSSDRARLRRCLLVIDSLLGIGQDAIHGRYADPDTPGDLGALQASASSLTTSAALARAVGSALVFPVLLRLGDTFPLPLQQEATFEFCYGPPPTMVIISMPVGLRACRSAGHLC